jgi:hypothetical protein
VFPCKPRAKEPLTEHGFKDATTDQKRITAWWQKWPDANIAMPTGAASGLLAVDIDPRNGGDKALDELQAEHGRLPDTAEQITGGGGRHIIFRHPGVPVPKALAPGIDLKGDGGYIVVALSIHPSGKPYQWDGPEGRNALLSPAEMPNWLRGLIAATSNGGTRSKPVAEMAEKWAPGNRNNLLTSLAGKMRWSGLSPQAIAAALLVENSQRCTPLPDDEVRSIARSVGRYEPPPPNKALRRPEIVTLSEVEARPVSWLWDPYLAFGTLAMLSGDPGAGKTFLSLAIAGALTVGRVPYSGEPCAPLHVLYLSLENNAEYVVRPRFDSLGGDPGRCHLLRGSIIGDSERADRGSIRLSDVPLLEDALQQTRARFVIVDPIQSYLGAEVDAHRANETRPVLDGLSRLAEEHGCCILLVRHLSKAPTGRAIHRGLGSIDLTGAVRTELMAGTAADGSERALVQVKNNLGQFGKSIGYTIEADGSFRWTGESELTPEAILAPSCTEKDRSAVHAAADFLREELRERPRLAKEIEAKAQQAGIASRTLKRAKERLRVVSSKDGMEGAWEWSLSEGGQQ